MSDKELIMYIQQKLKDAGYTNHAPNGEWDVKTQQLWIAYAGEHGMPLTNYPDEASLSKSFLEDFLKEHPGHFRRPKTTVITTDESNDGQKTINPSETETKTKLATGPSPNDPSHSQLHGVRGTSVSTQLPGAPVQQPSQVSQVLNQKLHLSKKERRALARENANRPNPNDAALNDATDRNSGIFTQNIPSHTSTELADEQARLSEKNDANSQPGGKQNEGIVSKHPKVSEEQADDTSSALRHSESPSDPNEGGNEPKTSGGRGPGGMINDRGAP